MNLNNLTAAQLRKAASIQERIQSLQKRLAYILGTKPDKAPTAEKPTRRKKRKMSAAGRAAIRAAQKARWAKIKAV